VIALNQGDQIVRINNPLL